MPGTTLPGTKRIYEKPSRLSQGLVAGLSIAVVAMAGWLAATIAFPEAATGPAEGDAETTAHPATAATTDGSAVSREAAAPSPSAASGHFDWPAEFASATATPAAPPPRMAVPPTPDLPADHDRAAPWPAAAPASGAGGDHGSPSRQQAGAAGEATDAIVDVLAPSPHRAAGKDPAVGSAAAVQTSRQGQHRHKPRIVSDAGQ